MRGLENRRASSGIRQKRARDLVRVVEIVVAPKPHRLAVDDQKPEPPRGPFAQSLMFRLQPGPLAQGECGHALFERAQALELLFENAGGPTEGLSLLALDLDLDRQRRVESLHGSGI